MRKRKFCPWRMYLEEGRLGLKASWWKGLG